MKPTFNIQAPEIDTASAHLFVEAGPTGISLVILDNKKCFSAVVIYSFSKNINGSIAEKMEDVINNEKLLQQQYNKRDIIWTFTESILVPPSIMNNDSNAEMLNLIYGDLNNGIIKSDFLYHHNLHNIFRVPVAVSDAFEKHFPYVGQTHQYSLLPNLVDVNRNHLFAIFYNNHFTVLLSKKGNLQLIRSFDFQHADDAAYYLLNVCENFEVNPEEVLLSLSGMIEAGSNLYAGLYKYFLNIQFETLPENFEYIEGIKEHPHHYFSYLFSLAACV